MAGVMTSTVADSPRGVGGTVRCSSGERVLIDGCGRRIDHLRLSVNDDCDLHCVYCRPQKPAVSSKDRTTLSDAQRIELVRFLHDRYGLSHVRITGGEPLLYRNVIPLVGALRAAFPDLSLAMTTNGRLLYRRSFDLYHAGLSRLNVSVDSLRPQRYFEITNGRLDDVLAGLDAATVVGFSPPKINTVVLRGLNDDEVVELARWALSRGSELRFLEAMPIGPAADVNRRGFVAAEEVRQRLAEHLHLTPLARSLGETAVRYRVEGDGCAGVLGFISPVSDPFCTSCRRLRVTSQGRLFPCLLDDRSVDLSGAWRDGVLRTSVAEQLIGDAVADKQPEGHRQATDMVSLGG